MAFFEYTVTRSPATGYTVGDTADLAIKCSDVSPGDFQLVGTEHKPLDGPVYFREHSSAEEFSITTAPILGATNNDLMKMFLRSIAGREIFLGNLQSNVGGDLTSYQLAGKLREPQRLAFQMYVYRFSVVAM